MAGLQAKNVRPHTLQLYRWLSLLLNWSRWLTHHRHLQRSEQNFFFFETDEAYSLAGGTTVNGGATSYGEEAIAVLLKEMEDRRGQFCTILAGYRDEMVKMISTNPGLESRIQFTLEFPDYTREELGLIAQSFLEKKGYSIDDEALNRLLDIMEYFRSRPNFANARTVRNVLDQVIMNQNLRTEDENGDSVIIVDDVDDYLMDEGIDLSKPSTGTKKIGFQ